MFELACTVHSGVFSNELLVTFRVVDGSPYSVLVDKKHVIAGDPEGTGRLRVAAQLQGERAIVRLPNDGSRVFVPSDELTPAAV
jgi:hypothetical protein